MKDPKKLRFIEAKEETIDNLEVLKQTLEMCVNAGMHDIDEEIYNKLVDLVDEAVLSKEKEELAEVIIQAKTIEVDLEAWLSSIGSSTISLSWPKSPFE